MMNVKEASERFFRTHILKKRSWASRYIVSILFLVIALFVVDILKDLEDARLYSLVFIASVLSAVYGGLGPAILVSIVGSLSLDFFFEEPLNDIFDSSASYIRFFLFSSSAILISALFSFLKDSLIQAEKLRALAGSANMAKDNLMSVVAHDLRNPLGVIVGFTELIKDKTEDTSVLNYVSIIKKNTSVCLELINDLQELSSLESKGYQLDLSNFDLAKLIEEVVLSMGPLASKKGISILLPKGTDNFFILADQRLIRRVFQNLIDNAIKYSPLGSRVKIEIDKSIEDLKVLIVDYGEGILETEQAKIFTPFYRTKVLPTAGESSTGLGLATVSAILKAHGAEIKVKSDVGKGSTFIVILPRR